MKTLFQALNKHDNSLKSLYIILLSKTIVLLLVLFSLLNIFYLHNYFLAAIELVYAILFSLIVLKLKQFESISVQLVAYLLTSCIAVVIYIAPISHLTIIWSLIVPINSFFLLGVNRGKKLTFVFFIYLLILMGFVKNDELNIFLNPNITLSYIILSLISYMYELYHQEYNEQKIRLLNQLTEEKEILEKMAVRDDLTELYNKVKIEKLLEEEFNRYKRYKIESTLMMIDIDDFKEVNKRYGHHTGDEVLQEFGALLKDNFRGIDSIGRWGGEEFLVILPNTSVDDACIQAERFCAALRKHIFSVEFSSTCSIGLTSFIEGDNVNSVLARTQKLLYTVKNGGKDGFLHY